jgi:exosortase D (VPLPA-CTERM-specific)
MTYAHADARLSPQAQAAPGRLAGAAWLIAAGIAGVAAFWPGLVSLSDAWSIPEYSHGPIIPLVSAFLFLREMRLVPPAAGPVGDRGFGVGVLALGLLVGLLGQMVRIPDIVTYGFIVWVAGMVLTCFGLRRGLIFWPSVLHLVFMLPLPQFVYWQVSVYLQLVSSQIGVWLITLFGIPVYLDGNIIDLGVYKLQVAEACSGLRYLFPMLSFSYVFALLYRGPAWHKAVLLLMAAPITVAMNSFRIGMIGVLVDSFGIGHAEGFLHAFEGWVIFGACVAILFAASALLQRLTAAPKPLSETLDVDFDGLGRQAARLLDVPRTAPLVAAACLTAAMAAGWAVAPEAARIAPAREPLALFPVEIDGRLGAVQMLDREIEAVLGADDYLSAVYGAREGGPPVDLFIAYYHRQTEGSGIHSPEVCLPTGGWEVSSWRSEAVTLEDGTVIPVNRALIRKGVSRQLVYYWFEQRGRRMTGDYAAKAMTIWDSLTRGRSDGGLVRLVTPLTPTEDESAAEARLRAFMAGIGPELPRFMPE